MNLNELFEQVRLKKCVLRCAKRDILMNYTDSLDEIVEHIEEKDFKEDERFPYFFRIWEAGVALADFLLHSSLDLSAKTILELGSGTGVTGVALATSGCRIIFSDYEPHALKLCERNCSDNGITNFTSILGDWRNFPEISEKVDLVICSDVLYEKKQVLPLFRTVKPFLWKGIPLYISDPNRGHIETFLRLLEDSHFFIQQVYGGKEHNLGNISIYKVEKQKINFQEEKL